MLIDGNEFVFQITIKQGSKTICENKILDSFESYDEYMEQLKEGNYSRMLMSSELCQVINGKLYGRAILMLKPAIPIDQYEKNKIRLTAWQMAIDPSQIKEHVKHPERYEYVCENCFNLLENCTCQSYPEHVIRMDKNMVGIIQKCNEKGYKTCFCCEGHPEDRLNDSIYISFKKRYPFKHLPQEWDYTHTGNLYCRIEGEDLTQQLQDKQKKLEQFNNWIEQEEDYDC